MDAVYKCLPEIIPTELQTLIHLFAGTCTPSCANMRTFIENLDNSKFLGGLETQWVALITMNTPRYLMRRFENYALTICELDLKIAYYELKHTRYSKYLNDNPGASSEFTRLAMCEWFQIEVETITKERTRRLHDKITCWSC